MEIDTFRAKVFSEGTEFAILNLKKRTGKDSDDK